MEDFGRVCFGGELMRCTLTILLCPRTALAVVAMKTLVYLALVAFLAIGINGEFRMEIVPEVAEQDQEVQLRCHVIGEDPRVSFEWYRMNEDGTHEVLAVNQLFTNPYLLNRDPGPFRMVEDYESEGNDAIFTIIITAAQVEDNANYGCNRATARDVTSHLCVTKAPDTIHMYGSDQPITLENTVNLDPFDYNQLLQITETSRGYFMCVANGFIPQPEIVMTFAGVELQNFNTQFSETIEHSENHQEYNYKVHNAVTTATSSLNMDTSANRLPLTCTASVPGHSVETMVRPVLQVAPQLDCEGAHVPNGARHVNVTCIVEADPELDILKWTWNTIDGKTVEMHAGENLDTKIRSTKIVMPDGRIETSILFDRVSPDLFRKYSLFARNELDDEYGYATLSRDWDAEEQKRDRNGVAHNCPTVGVIIATILAIWRLL